MSVNKAILVGHLGHDPEIRVTQSQTNVTSFSLATSEKTKDSTGQCVDKTEWHKVITFGKTADNCGKYLRKGSLVFVEGKIQTRKWQDKEGKDRWTTEIIGFEVRFLGPKKGNGGGYVDPQPQQGNLVDSLPSVEEQMAKQPVQTSFLTDDDIPF